MSNSPLVSYTSISPCKTSPRTHAIDTITIHCVVGQLTARQIAGCFADSSVRASCNYGIGKDGEISLIVEEKDRSWCSSNTENDNRAITIECACDRTHPYAINDAVYKSLIDLCTDICERNNIKELKWKADKSLIGQPDKQNMTVHRWFANKACPGDYIYERLGQIASEVNARLNGETAPVESETTEDTETKNNVPYTIAVTVSDLVIRKGPGESDAATGMNTGKGVFTIVEEQNGWGKLKSGAGWVDLSLVNGADNVAEGNEDNGEEVEEVEDTSNYTKIVGKSVATIEQMIARIKAANPGVPQSVIDMIPYYISEGEVEGIRGDVAFAQSCIETGNFTFPESTCAVTIDQNNFAMMGVVTTFAKGLSFDTPQLGIRAQIQHLKAYASTEDLVGECVDPRFTYVTRGCAPYVEWLGMQENPQGKGWASGKNYGASILRVLNEILSVEVENDTETAEPEVSESSKVPYTVYVDISDLAIWKGPGMSYGKTGLVTKKGSFTIVEEQDGWGKLKSGAGWIPLRLVNPEEESNVPYTVKVTSAALNVRSGPSVNYGITMCIRDKGIYTIVTESNGWGKLKSGAGWINLDYTKKI